MSILKSENYFDLKGKVVLVTGAGNGLGKGYAKIFAESGCLVACAGRNLEADQETAREIQSENGTARGFYVDVTDLPSIERMVAQVLEVYGRIDVLVNNAGMEVVAPFLEVTPENYDKIADVNQKGLYFVAQAVARAMMPTGGGKIINIGSLGSFIGLEESSVYCATKGAVIQLSKTMALELAKHNIQVNAIAPGYFVTPMTQPFYDDKTHRSWIESRIPLGRWGTVSDLAGPVIFLASKASDYITGQTVIVDGGWLAG
ncbi:MAG: polyketide synthase [delta proteobacterium ML8_F1]|nr:MAG: polyketide synthase [delta proteobacterium ML8_F1]